MKTMILRHRSAIYLTIICFYLLLFSACASIVSGSRQSVAVNTEPAGARVFINGKDQNAITPTILNVRKRGKVDYLFTLDGYQDGLYTDKSSFNGWFVGNLVFGGIPGMAIDAATGAMHNISSNVSYSLTPLQPGDPIASEMVTRDAPGQTELERTIIRWRIDSEPRGARIFYRVISSIPEVVKNTNETYLTTTPYEETRSFNILGLTYENSRDVTIEFKVSRTGYEDQVKRFNVRQVIDQQEISSFFELVPKAQ